MPSHFPCSRDGWKITFLRATLIQRQQRWYVSQEQHLVWSLLTLCHFQNLFFHLEKAAIPFYSQHSKEFIMRPETGLPLEYFSQANNKPEVCRRFTNAFLDHNSMYGSRYRQNRQPNQGHLTDTTFCRGSGRRRKRRAKRKQKLWLSGEISVWFHPGKKINMKKHSENHQDQAFRVFVMEAITVGIQETGSFSSERAQDWLWFQVSAPGHSLMLIRMASAFKWFFSMNLWMLLPPRRFW